jgi:hypothetical protein
MLLMATLANAELDRIDRDLFRLRRNPRDGAMLARFAYDHGNTLVYDTMGKCDLLIENDTDIKRDCARLLQHCSPAIIKELLRGYGLARDAGLLED